MHPRDTWNTRPEVQPDTATSYTTLRVDVDGVENVDYAFDVLARGEVAGPNWTVFNTRTGNFHAVWCLADPVHRYNTAKSVARQWPIEYLADVGAFYTEKLHGDPCYAKAAITTHNPCFRDPIPAPTPYFVPLWGEPRAYRLRELAASRTADWKRRQKNRYRRGEEPAGASISRHVYLLWWLKRFAGSPEGRYADLYRVAADFNNDQVRERFGEALGDQRGERRDVQYLARYVEVFSAGEFTSLPPTVAACIPVDSWNCLPSRSAASIPAEFAPTAGAATPPALRSPTPKHPASTKLQRFRRPLPDKRQNRSRNVSGSGALETCAARTILAAVYPREVHGPPEPFP